MMCAQTTGSCPSLIAPTERASLSVFQRAITDELSAGLSTIPRQWWEGQVRLERNRRLTIAIRPIRVGSSQFTVYVPGGTVERAEIEAGDGLYLHCPGYQPMLRELPVVTQVGRIVNSIIEGRFREDIYYRKGMSYRWICRIDVNSESIILRRFNLPRLLRALPGRRHKASVSYLPYGGPAQPESSPTLNEA